MGVMGAFEHTSSGSGQPGAPTIIVNGVALMGGVEVRRKPPKKFKRDPVESGRQEELDPRWDHRRERLEARRERLESRREYLRERRESRRPGELD
jgi:hypothetical protein